VTQVIFQSRNINTPKIRYFYENIVKNLQVQEAPRRLYLGRLGLCCWKGASQQN